MKGLTHFIVGISIATCFPLAIEATLYESSLIILLGGIFGILSDTLDFRFSRYVYEHDYEIQPGAEDPDPWKVTDAMVEAIDRAHDEQRKVSIKLHTIKISADMWRQYSVLIDTEQKRIVTRIGPLVTTGQSPIPDSEPEGEEGVAEARYRADLVHTYEKETMVDIFSGPDFAFVPDGDKVRADFIPWHRQWSHSLTFPFLLAPIGLLLYGLNDLGWTAFFIILLAFWGHVVVDQLGILGSNLFWPFTKNRTVGFGLFHSSASFANFGTNFCAVALAIWNLNAYAPRPSFTMPWPAWLGLGDGALVYFVGFVNYIIYYVVVPLGVLYALILLYRRSQKRPGRDVSDGEWAMEEALDEIGETMKS